jgi:hypothetical protein
VPVQTADKFILYSGGAMGADTLFGTNAQWYGVTEQNYSFRGHKNCRARGRIILDEAELKRADEDLLAAIGIAFKKHQGKGDSAEKYWQRNWHQVQKSREIFAVIKDMKTFLDFTRTRIEGAAIGIAVAIKTKKSAKGFMFMNKPWELACLEPIPIIQESRWITGKSTPTPWRNDENYILKKSEKIASK